MQAFTTLRIFLLFGMALFSVVAALANYSARAQDVPSDAGTVVNLRIEGANNTIFEGPIFTRGHNVTTVSGGTHHCDGTNLNANPTPGPTCTSALDDASKLARFTWVTSPGTRAFKAGREDSLRSNAVEISVLL